MSEKKNIDKLFKEQFKNFEQVPDDAVWQRIEDELHKDKRKRRVIPIWWKLAGVAAVLALLFTIGNVLTGSFGDSSTEQQVVGSDTENNISTDPIQKDKSNDLIESSTNKTSEDISNEAIVNQDSSVKSNTIQTEAYQLSSTEKNGTDNDVTSNDAVNSENAKTNTVINKNKSQIKNAVANVNNKPSDKSIKEKSNTVLNPKSTNAIAKSVNDVKKENTEENMPLKKEQFEIDKLIKEAKQSKETQVTSATNSEQDKAETLIDTLATKELIEEENAIEKAIAEAKKEEEDETKEDEDMLKRWSVAPNVAPVYFSTLGKGSSLDNQFIENTKEGNVSVSYGVKGSYALNKKLKIRAGVNRVDLGYSTNNVLVFEGVSPNTGARQMQNVDVSNMQTNNTYVSASALSFNNAPEILNAKERGSIEQQLGFIEVPLELEYNLVDKTFGLNLIGGFSTLFLNNNEIYSVENNGSRTLMGEATNIKDMSYSANFGVGVNYNISEQLRFNLEPTFKYQINTFSNTSGDFQPFFIGVYTGLSFKF